MGKLILKWSKFGQPMPNPLLEIERNGRSHFTRGTASPKKGAIPFVMPFSEMAKGFRLIPDPDH
jgi:hypothetical protein